MVNKLAGLSQIELNSLIHHNFHHEIGIQDICSLDQANHIYVEGKPPLILPIHVGVRTNFHFYPPLALCQTLDRNKDNYLFGRMQIFHMHYEYR